MPINQLKPLLTLNDQIMPSFAIIHCEAEVKICDECQHTVFTVEKKNG